MNAQSITRMKVVNGLKMLLSIQEIQNVKVSDLCKKSGVSRATFYRHFYNVMDVAFWLWDECNKESLYKMGNPYGWQKAHILQFTFVSEHRDFFKQAFTNSDYDSITVYGGRNILRTITLNITEANNYIMSEQEQFELEYYICGCSHMFSKWAREGMRQSPEEMTDLFGRLIPPFVRAICK